MKCLFYAKEENEALTRKCSEVKNCRIYVLQRIDGIQCMYNTAEAPSTIAASLIL
jgi:hypothetical protein